MACETRDLRHGGVFPDYDLVLAITMSRNDLIGVLGPGEVADLRPGIDFVDGGTVECVVEDNSPICGSSS